MANPNKSRPAAKPAASANANGKTTTQPTSPASNTSSNTGNTTSRRLTQKQEAARRRVQKRRRIQLLVTGAIVLVIAAALIIIGISISQPVNFVGIPAAATTDGPTKMQLGPDDAKVTVEEFADYQCPFCKQWEQNTQPQFVADYITSNKGVKLVFKNFPFIDRNTGARESHLSSAAAYCAADQKRFVDYHNALYANQPASENSGFWTTDHLKALAKALNMDTNAFNTCLDSNKYNNQTTADATAASGRGVSGTPTFFVNGTLVQGGEDYNTLKTAIESALASAK